MPADKPSENGSNLGFFKWFFHAVCKASSAGIPVWRHGLLSYENACCASSACYLGISENFKHSGQKKMVTYTQQLHQQVNAPPLIIRQDKCLEFSPLLLIRLIPCNFENELLHHNIKRLVAYLFKVQSTIEHVECRWPSDFHIDKQHECFLLSGANLNFQKMFFAFAEERALTEKFL